MSTKSEIVRLIALPLAMAAFIMAAQMSGGLVLRTEQALIAIKMAPPASTKIIVVRTAAE
jgi:hypothetical protein